MRVRGKVIVVTGGGRGIGRGLCQAFADHDAEAVVVADCDTAAAARTAAEIGGTPVTCDVAREADIQKLVADTLDTHGRIDVFCSNAGITVKGGLEIAGDDWQRTWDINLMAHVHAARAVVPGMLERGSGYLLQTVSAAGLLTEIGSAAYSVTKHAALGFAEWLNVQYRDKGVAVSCVCPLGVATDMLDDSDPIHQFLQLSALPPREVAESIVTAMQDQPFLILPHPEVAEFFQLKATDYDRWLHYMNRLNRKLQRRKAA